MPMLFPLIPYAGVPPAIALFDRIAVPLVLLHIPLQPRYVKQIRPF